MVGDSGGSTGVLSFCHPGRGILSTAAGVLSGVFSVLTGVLVLLGESFCQPLQALLLW